MSLSHVDAVCAVLLSVSIFGYIACSLILKFREISRRPVPLDDRPRSEPVVDMESRVRFFLEGAASSLEMLATGELEKIEVTYLSDALTAEQLKEFSSRLSERLVVSFVVNHGIGLLVQDTDECLTIERA